MKSRGRRLLQNLVEVHARKRGIVMRVILQQLVLVMVKMAMFAHMPSRAGTMMSYPTLHQQPSRLNHNYRYMNRRKVVYNESVPSFHLMPIYPSYLRNNL